MLITKEGRSAKHLAERYLPTRQDGKRPVRTACGLEIVPCEVYSDEIEPTCERCKRTDQAKEALYREAERKAFCGKCERCGYPIDTLGHLMNWNCVTRDDFDK